MWQNLSEDIAELFSDQRAGAELVPAGRTAYLHHERILAAARAAGPVVFSAEIGHALGLSAEAVGHAFARSGGEWRRVCTHRGGKGGGPHKWVSHAAVLALFDGLSEVRLGSHPLPAHVTPALAGRVLREAGWTPRKVDPGVRVWARQDKSTHPR